jgi:hypothetical protein
MVVLHGTGKSVPRIAFLELVKIVVVMGGMLARESSGSHYSLQVILFIECYF